jgi:hypothetical protein
MKKLLLIFSFVLLSISSFGQLTSNTFTGASACPTNGNTFSAVTNATVAPMSRNTAICSQTANVFSNTTLNATASRNDNSYIEFSITANTGFGLNLTSLSFFRQGSNTAPNSLIVSYSTDPNPANFNATRIDMPISTTANPGSVLTWTFASAIVTTAGGKATFRFYPFGTTRVDLTAPVASASGTFRVDDVTLNGSVINLTPTLIATPTTIPAFNYTSGNGPSTANSYALSGEVLTVGDSVKVFAPTNFEVSKTSATIGFADSLKILYAGTILPMTNIYVRLKAGLADGTYMGNVTHKGGGVATLSLPSVSVSGSVTFVPPPIVTVTGTLNPFTSFIGVPPTSQSYTVSGINLVDNITITAPFGYLIKTGTGAYSTSIVLPQVSGNVATTTIDIRLIGTTIGAYSGNIVHTSMTLTSAVNKAVTGTVSSTTPCGMSQKIRDVRNAIPELPSLPTGTGLVKTIKGQITGIFGTTKIYVSDSTGGIAVYGTGLVNPASTTNNFIIGDSVQLTATTNRHFGEAELTPVTCIYKLAPGITPVPAVYNVNTAPTGVNLQTFLDANEGGLVKIIGVNLLTTGSFTASTNYPISTCNNQGDSEVRIDITGNTNIPTTTIPTVTQNITGLVGHYITATQTINIFQLFPNKASDFENSAITCTPVIVPASASCGPLAAATVPTDSTLDVTCWNVEWLGNTTSSPSALGPTNDAQQMTNVLQVLNTVKSDIFCIEEVCDHKQFIARVKTDLPKYKVRCQTKYYSHFFDTPEKPADATTFSQKVCFVYDSTVVTMVDTISVLSNIYTYPANNWASGRLPFLFIGDVKVGNVTKQIHFVGLHAKSGSAIADYNRRKQDVIDLKLKLDTAYPNANIIMLGDYNDDLDTSIAAAQPSSYKNFVTDNVNYKQISRALSLCGVSSTAKYPDIIDHFLMSNEFGVIPETGPNPAPSTSGIYYLDKTINVSRPINYVANYTTTTSDHYPVNARFRFGLPPVPPATITSSNSGNWSSASTWDCNCVPTSASDVVINTGNTVTVDIPAKAKSLNVKGILNWLAAFTLTLGI